MALQRFTRRAAEAAQGTGEAKDALAQMGIALRDQSGNLRRSEDLLGDVADAFARIEDPAERVRLAFKLFRFRRRGAPSKAFGALSWPLIGLNSPEPAPPVGMRSTSVIMPFADRL
jgi:hypothetical protein